MERTRRRTTSLHVRRENGLHDDGVVAEGYQRLTLTTLSQKDKAVTKITITITKRMASVRKVEQLIDGVTIAAQGTTMRAQRRTGHERPVKIGAQETLQGGTKRRIRNTKPSRLSPVRMGSVSGSRPTRRKRVLSRPSTVTTA